MKTNTLYAKLIRGAAWFGLAACLAGVSAAADETPPVTAAPEALHGFSGLLLGKLVSKDNEQGELVMHIQRVKRVWRGNKAENPRRRVGKSLRIDGISGKFLDVLLLLKEGDTFEIEARHTRGDHLDFLGEGFKKVEPARGEEREQVPAGETITAGMRGFNGMLVGKLLSKDVEQGELTIKVTRVKRVWRNNKAKAPFSYEGKTLVVKGVFGKFLDTLLLLRPGELVELEAKHNRGQRLDFPGEWLRKAPGDEELARAPVDEARGFNGQVQGIIADKGEALIALKVARIVRTAYPANQAKNPDALIGKTIKIGPQNEVHGRFLERVKEGQPLTLNIRSGEGEAFVITELLREQRALAEDE